MLRCSMHITVSIESEKRALPSTDLLMSGVELMLLGMSIVFGFLTILVFSLHGMSKLADTLQGRHEAATTSRPGPAATPGDMADEPDVVAAIAVAVAHYRKRLGK